MKNSGGFSLLELLTVVALILIIASLVIPSMLRARQSANESGAVANLRGLNAAELGYHSSSAGSYGTIDELILAGYIDNRYSTGTSGYQYSIDLATGRTGYTAFATATASNSGRYDYFTAPDYVIRYSTVTGRAPSGLAGLPVR